MESENFWLQVDIGLAGSVGFVSTKSGLAFPISYHLAYSVDNSTWNDYQENGSRKLFHGNWEGATVVKNAILSPFEARFVRFIPNECSEDDCLLEAEAYLLIKESRTNIISLSSENSSSTGLAMFKMQDSLTYQVQVRTMEGLVWSLSFDMSQESHDWTHLTISWHEMWGLKVFINGEVAKKNNMPEEILNDTLIVSTHIEIGGVTSEIYNASSLGTNLQMSDLRIWERLVSRKEARTNYEVSMNVSSGLWYVIKMATFKTEGAVQTSRWILRASCTLSSHTGPCDDGSPREFPPLCNAPLGLESGLVSDSQITSSSVRGPGFENHNARLNYLSCWSTLELDPWIQVELRAFTRVTKVSTQGRPDADEWVQSYAIKYQVTKISPLLDYESEGDFQGNFDRSTIVAHDILATGMIFRIYPKSWYTQPSLRLELYGCSLDEHSFRHIESSYPRERGDKARMLTLHATESHKCLSFTYHMNGSTIGRLNVFIRGPDSEESLLWRLAGSQGNKWNTATVPIERKSPYQIVFEGVVGDSYTGDIVVDNISLGLDNSCTFKPVTARREIAGFRSDLLQNGPWFQDTLMEWLAEKGLGDEYWVPCFRGSLHSWNASLFKSQCRNKKSTVALIRKGDCLFGGFSDKPWEGPVTGFIPSTKSFLFTLQSSSSLSSEAKWPVLSSQRSRAIFYAPGRLQFGEDLVLNLTNRSLSVNIGHVYDIENEDGDLFCGANGTIVEADDVEVLSPLDTLCDVPCVRGQHCDEICGKCVCDTAKRDVQRCYERAGLQTDRDESCEPVRYARFDFNEHLTSKQWRCYRPSGLTRDKARYNGESGVYNTVHGAMLQIREDNYPSLVLEDEVLRAEYYFPMDNPDHVHSSKDNILSWSTSFNGKTMGVKDNAVFTNGKTNATLLFNSLGCISDPKLCAEGLTLSLWMKHTNRYGGQTFLSTGGSDIDAANLTRGFRIFQLNGSFDHIAVDMRNEFKRCRWVFTAPQNIWSHLVIKFYSILSGDCVTLKFFLNRDLQVPLFSEERKENYTLVGPMVLIGDLSTGSPTATFDEFAIWYEKISDGYIHRFYDYYKATQYTVNLTLEREITDDQGASFYTDLEKMEAASFSLIQEVKTLSSADNINTVTLRKYGYRQQSVSSTLSAFVTVVYNDSSGQVPDLLNLGTTLSPTWTLVDKQSSEVDLQGINIFASNKSNVASVNVTVSPSAAQLNLAGIFHGYIIFYKEIDEVNYQSQRVISAEMSFLIPGLKHWTLYDIYARLVTLNGIGKRSNELMVWTRPVAPENVTVYSINRGLHVHWENINSSEIHQYRVLVTAVYYTSNNATCNETVVSGLDHSLVCENVNIFINYSVTVRAEGNIVGAYSEPVYFMIEAEVPENISARAISSVEVHVSWDPVPVPQLTGYMVQYRKVDNNITSQNVTVYDASRSSVVLHGLLPASNYSILVLLVFADRLKNLSNEVFVATKESLTVYPAGFQATGTSPTSIFLQWNATEFRDLVGYVIYYNLSDINSTGIQNRMETYIGACNTSVEIFNLKPLTNYSLQIAGFTRYEIGPGSQLITVQTQRQPLEEPPPSIELSPWSLSAIQVSWSPLSFELLRGYVIFYKPMESPGRRKRSAPPLAELNETITSLNTSRRFLTGLNEFTNYSVQAAGFTDFEVGPRTITVYIITNQTVPVVPPRGIKVTSVDSTTLQVCWERIPHFPSLEEYEVHYTPFGQGNASVLSTRANITVATLTGLDPSLTYSVRVAGKTAEGLGPLSSPIAIQTSNFSISKLTAFTRGNSSIIVCLPRQQTVSASSVVYHEVNVAPNLAQRINVSDFSRKYLMIQNLSTHLNYSVELEFALTCGQNRKSEPTYVVTGRKGPLAAPRRVKANMTDYSSACVKWSPNPSPLVLEYVIQFAPLDASISVITVRVNSTETMVEIDGLTSSTNYSVQLHTVTLCKNGSWSKAVYVASEEGVPNLPPQDLVAENHTSLSTIPVSWRPIPPQNVCGVLLEYRVRYTPMSLVDGTELDGTPQEKVLPAGNLSTTLENLNRYTVYKIEVWGATRKGEGPSATIFAETCYCHKQLTTNWMFFPPYVDHVIDNSTSSLPIGGIIPKIVVDMVSACCGYCRSHGESYVDYSSYTSKETLRNKKTYNDMVENISQEIDFSFPVFGFEGKLNYKNDYRFIDLIQSPGIAHIVNTKVDNSKEYSLFAAVIGLWPVMAITMVSVLLSGIVIWYLEREENTEQFKSSFIRGTSEGVWWSYISATTVGYGDRAPVTGYGRLFSVFWILMGLVIIGILNGSITTALTSFTIDLNFDIYGKKVAAVQQSPEFRFGIRKNAKMDNVSYKTFREVFSALESGKVIHALFDTYAIGSERALFDKARHLYIYKIYDYSSTYGIVFGGDSAVLQKCFDLFKRGNIADIFVNIKENIDSIETGKPLVLEMSTGLFEVSSPLFKNIVFYCGFCMAVAVVLGLIWEIFYRCKGNNKIRNDGGLKHVREQMNDVSRLREMVEDLQQRMRQTYTDLKAKHTKELLLLKETKNEKQNSRDHMGNQEWKNEQRDHFPTGNLMRIGQFKSGSKAETYAHNSNNSVEEYFDNLK